MTEQFNENLKYAYGFDPNEKNSTAASVYSLLDGGGPRILDLGSGPAIVSTQFAGRPGYMLVCADADQDALKAAEKSGAHKTHVVDLDSQTWFTSIQHEEFDSIVLADVLEHLRRPQDLLESLLRENILAEGGQLVISIPNANHVSLVGSLLAGDFAYTKTGLFDETHIRWFTLESITRLLEEQGFSVDRVFRTTRNLEQTDQSRIALNLSEAARTSLAELGLDGKTLQFVLRATRRSERAAGPLAIQAMDNVKEELDRVSKQRVKQLQDRVEEAIASEMQSTELALQYKGELEALRSLLRQERSQVASDLAKLSNEIAWLRRKVRTFQNSVRDIHASRSYRLSRMIAAGTHPIKFAKARSQRKNEKDAGS